MTTLNFKFPFLLEPHALMSVHLHQVKRQVLLLLLLFVEPTGTPPIALQPSRPFLLLTPL
jgi:hypothetical protein